MAKKEVNFKSKLLEWTQKNRVKISLELQKQSLDTDGNSPMFEYLVFIEGVKCGRGKGYTKKESQQNASKETLQMLRKQPKHVDKIFAAKSERTKMEEMPVMEVVPEVKPVDNNPLINIESVTPPTKKSSKKAEDEFDLSDISLGAKSREEIIAEAEAAAFSAKQQ